jgi:hypothetical protein
MTVPQIAHKDTIIDTWKKKFAGRTFTIHPIKVSSSAGSNFPATDDESAQYLLSQTPSSSLYTPGTFTIPANAEPTYSASTRKASYSPQGWSIACLGSQTANLFFSQYFVLMDEATSNQLVHYVSAQLSPPPTITPGYYYTEALTLETD